MSTVLQFHLELARSQVIVRRAVAGRRTEAYEGRARLRLNTIQKRWGNFVTALRSGWQSHDRMLAYVRPYWLPLTLGALSLEALTLLSLAIPWAVQKLVDVVVVGEDWADPTAAVFPSPRILL